ncbi:PHD finger protein 7-like isoform X2 [Dromaius novaehollandiae]|uniref:PHD finger protein 7-like isoform X2 n=1 Tax=Dromaius novaehollandiae TaxID=8790 RepID=UPI00311DA1AC
MKRKAPDSSEKGEGVVPVAMAPCVPLPGAVTRKGRDRARASGESCGDASPAWRGAHRWARLLSPLQRACCAAGRMSALRSAGRRTGSRGCASTSSAWSFCSEHRPEQAVPVRPDEETTCIICMERVDEKLSFGTLVCPACRGAWFHRGCIQGQASRAGRECFRCPQCKNKRKFLPEMLKMGIYVLFRPPAWEETGQYEELYERHSQCDAGQCLYREGRQQAQESGPWELLLCSSCASRGTHRHCSAVGAAVEAWECDGCAGIGPAPSALPEPSAPSTSSKPGAETSSSPAAPASAELDLASSSTSSKPGAEASSSSAAPASSKPDLASSITSTSSQDESEASSSSATPATSESDLVSSRAGSQEESGSSPGSPAPESSPQAGRPGPE